jgi:hypothetical protein
MQIQADPVKTNRIHKNYGNTELSGTDLTDADLTRAELIKAEHTCPILTSAKLTGARRPTDVLATGFRLGLAKCDLLIRKVSLTSEDGACLESCRSRAEATFQVKPLLPA